MIAIAFDGALAPILPNQVGVSVSLPSLSKRGPSRGDSRFTFGGCSFTASRAPLFGFRMLSSADLSQIILRGCASSTCRYFAGVAYRHADRRRALSSLSQIALNSERPFPFQRQRRSLLVRYPEPDTSPLSDWVIERWPCRSAESGHQPWGRSRDENGFQTVLARRGVRRLAHERVRRYARKTQE